MGMPNIAFCDRPDTRGELQRLEVSLPVEKRHECISLDEEYLHKLPLNLERPNTLFEGLNIAFPGTTED